MTRIEAHHQLSFFVVYRDEQADPSVRLARATAMWGLTRRQAAVLTRLVIGESNKTIAARLKRAEDTIELHVSQLLRRAGVEGRTMLVARFWTA